MKIKWKLNFGFLSLEPEGEGASGPLAAQPLYERLEEAREKIENAVMRNSREDTSLQLMFAARLTSSSRVLALRRQAVLIAKTLQSNDLGSNQSLDEAFEAALTCFEQIRQAVLAELQSNPPAKLPGDGLGGKPAPSSGEPPLIRVVDLRIAFKDRLVFQDVNLEAQAGEIIGLTGGNGSGKTTLLESLAEALPLSGVNKTGQVSYPALEERFSLKTRVLDEVLLVSTRYSWPGTVENCLRMYASLRGVSKTETADQVAYAITLLGLNDYKDHSYLQLSEGYRTRFELAKVHIYYPRILLLDEPFAPLDATARRSYARILRDLAGSSWGMTIIVTAQDSADLRALADRTVVLEGGKLVSLEEIAAQEGHLFEIGLDATEEQVAELFEDRPSISLDLDVLPWRVLCKDQDSIEVVRKVLLQSKFALRYFRDITGTIDRTREDV